MGNYLKAKTGVYKIPILERTCNMVVGMFAKHKFYREVDGIGLFIRSELPPEQVTDKMVRGYLIGLEHKHCLVYADNIIKAIETFHNEWEGAKVGTKEKALYISDNKYEIIYGYPKCRYMFIHRKTDEPYCGNPEKKNIMYSQGCILEQFDAPEYCPIMLLNENLYDNLKDDQFFTVIVNGVEYRYVDQDALSYFKAKNNKSFVYPII